VSWAEDPEVDAAYARGLTDGMAQGATRLRQELDGAVAALAAAAQELTARQEAFTRDRYRNLESLALVVAQKLLEREVATHPSIVRDLVARALELLPNDDVVSIRLNPLDLQASSHELKEMATLGRPLQLKLLPDPDLARGSFLLETPLRVIDGRTDTALRQLYERLDHD
jgi:flagellar biosynthesis/type III secretory pathway protein FliH